MLHVVNALLPLLLLFLALPLPVAQVDFLDNKGTALLTAAGASLTVSGAARFLRNRVHRALTLESGSSVTFSGAADFVDNAALANGGAIRVQDSGSLVFDAGSSLLMQGNRAASWSGGGALYMQGAARVTLAAGSVASFVDNTAGGDGGAVLGLQGGVLQSDGTMTMRGNTADLSGGAARLADGSRLLLYGTTTIQENTAGLDGGAVAMSSSTRCELSSAHIIRNRAGRYGGGLFFNNGASMEVVGPAGSVCISGNAAAAVGGGAYMAQSTSLLFNGDITQQVMGGNTPDGIAIESPSGASFSCAGDATSKGPGTYLIEGSVCSCAAPQAPGDTVACSTCPAGQPLWDIDTCTCRVSRVHTG